MTMYLNLAIKLRSKKVKQGRKEKWMIKIRHMLKNIKEIKK
jgi:hypothetical protein